MVNFIDFFFDTKQKVAEESATVQKIASQISLCALAGFSLGGYKGSQKAALQHIVENLHQTPRNKSEWFSYYRDRNFKVYAAFD